MTFKNILFVPTTDNLELPDAQALLGLAAPGTHIDVFEPVYNTDLEDYSAVDFEKYEQARDELVRKRLERVAGLVDALQARGLEAAVTAAWDHPVHEAIIRRALATKADLVVTEPIEGRAGHGGAGQQQQAAGGGEDQETGPPPQVPGGLSSEIRHRVPF